MKKSPNSRNQCFSYSLCLMIEGSGSISLTNGSGCGSGRPKNIWILRIRILIRNTDRNINYKIEKNLSVVHQVSGSCDKVANKCVHPPQKIIMQQTLEESCLKFSIIFAEFCLKIVKSNIFCFQ